MNSSFGNSDGDGPSRPSSSSSSFRDRFMGKPSSEVLADLQDQFDREREMFFQNRPSFGNRDFTESPFRRRFFQRSGRFSDPTQPDMSSSSAPPEEDPFDGKDSIPIRVIHEYTSGKPPTGATPSGDASKLGANAATADGERATFLAPQKSASANEVQPTRKQPAYHKSSSAGVKSTPAVSEPVERSLNKIASVEAALNELTPSLDAFSGPKSSKDYIYLDEMLTRNLIKLDDVETHGSDDVRAKRKETVRKIQSLVEKLESKAISENGEDRRVYDPTDEGTSV